MIDEGETGHLFPAGDHAALRNAMCDLWTQPRERRRMGINARLAVEKRFSERGRIASLIGTYNRLCNVTAGDAAASRPVQHSELTVLTD